MFYQTSVDAYGFERPTNFDFESYEKFMENYLSVLQRRAGRWMQVLGDQVEKEKLVRYLKGRQFKRFVRKGIPTSHRPLVWMMTSGAQGRMEASPNHFIEMLQRPNDPEAKEQINLDLHRTFPDNVFFKKSHGAEHNRAAADEDDLTSNQVQVSNGDNSQLIQEQIYETSSNAATPNITTLPVTTSSLSATNTPMSTPTSTRKKLSKDELHKQEQLRDVLTAFANHNPTIGYCQGLNFVTGLLLLIVEDEERAFWLLDALVNHILPDYYSKDMIGLRADTRALGEIVASRMPDVAQLMEREGVTWDLVTSRWLLCLFVDVLPIETVLRTWDVLFNEGSKILFRVSLTLVKNAEPKLLTCQNLPSIVSTFSGMMRDPLALHCHAFMEAVFEKMGSLSSKTIEQNRDASRKEVKEEDAKMRL